jgi:hypothetical protein
MLSTAQFNKLNWAGLTGYRKISLIGENEGQPDLLVRQVVTLFRVAYAGAVCPKGQPANFSVIPVLALAQLRPDPCVIFLYK